MYEQEFGLKKGLFSPNAAGTDVFVAPQLAIRLAAIKKAFTSRDTGIPIFGVAGVGKTTLVNRALDTLTEDRQVIQVGRMRLDSSDVLELMLNELGLKNLPGGTIQKFSALRRRMLELQSSGTRIVVVIEDAERLGIDTIAEIEALTAADGGESDGANLIIMGNERLTQFLNDPQLARLIQRLRHAIQVEPFSEAELRGYLKHCFRLAGGDFESAFDTDSVGLAHFLCGGIARTTNNLVQSAMAAGAATGKVSTELLAKVAKNDLDLDSDAYFAELEAQRAASAAAQTEAPQELASEPSEQPATEQAEAAQELPVEPLETPQPVEAPVVLQALVEEPAIEEPIVEEPIIEEALAVEPAVEEPVVEQPAVDEGLVAELVVEESAIEEPAIPEPASIAPVVAQSEVEELQMAEPAAEVPAVEESPAPEPVIEAVAIEDTAFDLPVLRPANADEATGGNGSDEMEIPELIQDTLPDLKVLSPELAEQALQLEPEMRNTELPDLELETLSPQESQTNDADIPDWERDPTLAELRPDLDALEQAMAFVSNDEPVAKPAAAPATNTQPEPLELQSDDANIPTLEPAAIPEITLDNAISEGIELQKSEATKDNSEDAVDKAKNEAKEQEARAIAADLANARSLEDVDDRMAETLFGSEISLIASQMIKPSTPAASQSKAGPINDELSLVDEPVVSTQGMQDNSAAAVEVTLETRPESNGGGLDLSASQRLKTVRALNADLHPSLREPDEVAANESNSVAPPVESPTSIEEQINVSMTQSFEALKIPTSEPEESEEANAKSGFFSRFKRS